MVSFCQRLKKLVILPVRRRRKLRFLRNFWRLRLKFKGFLYERRRRERKFWEYFAGERYFYASGRKGCWNCGPFCSAGGVLEHPQHPPSLRACGRKSTASGASTLTAGTSTTRSPTAKAARCGSYEACMTSHAEANEPRASQLQSDTVSIFVLMNLITVHRSLAI